MICKTPNEVVEQIIEHEKYLKDNYNKLVIWDEAWIFPKTYYIQKSDTKRKEG
jgi:hypothetical protein